MPELAPLLVLIAAVGLVVGSYLNVVIHRLPRGRSTVWPPSGCPACGSLIPWWGNLPVLSFLWLRGRCRECRSPISWRYPIVEALVALLFVLCFFRFGPSWSWLGAALFSCLLVVLAMIDLEHLLLPDRLTLPGVALGWIVQPWLPWGGSWLDGVLGSVAGAGTLLALYGLWWVLRKVEGLGLGDVKMMAMVGAFVGLGGALTTLLIGTVLAASFAVTSMMFGRLSLQHRLPFGPFLAVGAAAAMFESGSGWLRAALPLLSG